MATMSKTAAGEAKNRLTNIVVEEVSLVDSGANGWPFLVVKRSARAREDGETAATKKAAEVVVNEAGELSAVDKAVWSTAFVNDLPDSSFLYIKPGGEKDADGKTTPRSLRMFPYKDADGAVDLPHLRNAIARIPQAAEISQDQKDTLQAEARRLLEEQGGNADTGEEETEKVTMSFAQFAAKAAKVEVDKAVVMKQVGAAMAKLETISQQLALDPQTLMSGDKWDVRQAVGEAIDILVIGAKLEAMLAGAGTPPPSASPAGETAAAAKTSDEPEQKQETAPPANSEEQTQTETKTEAEPTDAEKAGKTLSTANEEKLRKLVDGLNELLSAMTAAKEAKEPKEKTAAAASDVDTGVVAKALADAERVIREQQEAIKTLKAQPAQSNAAPVEGAVAAQKAAEDFWPRDMGQKRSRR